MKQEALFEVAGTDGTGPLFDLENVGTKNYLTHNFHPYPAKFIPQIPGAILDHYAPRHAVVLDPFCGSGTVAVESMLRGYSCIANDLNPIATLITRAKTAVLTSNDYDMLRLFLLRLSRNGANEGIVLPEFKNRDLWFSATMLHELAVIRNGIKALPEASAAQSLAWCAFSAIIVKCSNQESETHWRSKKKEWPRGFAFRSFSARLSDMVIRSHEFAGRVRGSVQIRTGSALALDSILDGCVDMAVTSPPYANSHDYYLYNKLRMFWLGFDHYPIQEREIGSRHRHSDLREPIENYYDEMRIAFVEIRRVLKPRGILAIIVGDSIVRGQFYDMGLAYQDMASELGFSMLFKFDFDQRRYTSAFQRGLKTAPKKSHILIFRA